jgi:hypothetical protein
MKTKNNKLIQIILILLLAEKIIQHAFTAMAFLGAIPGVGTPDIGTRLEISNPMMGVANAVLAALFVCAIWGFSTGKQWGKMLILSLGVFDIAAEFILHGFFFITFSVIGAAILIILVLIYPIGKIPAGASL